MSVFFQERQMHRVLRDLCRLVRPDITSSSQASGSGGGTEINPKVEVYRMCGFMAREMHLAYVSFAFNK